jgi:hypothetical protein
MSKTKCLHAYMIIFYVYVLDDERQMMEIMFIPVHHELTLQDTCI